MRFLLEAVISLLIAGQQDFSALPERLSAALEENPSEIEIQFAPGVYYYPNEFLSLEDVERPDVRLTLRGEDAVFIASNGGDNSYTFESGYVDLDALHHVDPWSEMRQAYLWPIRIPFTKEYLLWSSREIPMDKEALSSWKLLLTQWYIGALYPIEKVGRHYIIFRREPKYHTRMWSELRFGRCFPRYLFCRPPSPDDPRKLYATKACRFLSVNNTSLRSLSLEGMRFLGNAEQDWLLYFQGCRTDSVSIRNCDFEGIRSGVVSVRETDHFRLSDSRFVQCYQRCAFIWTTSKDCIVRRNAFYNNGRRISTSPLVDCKADGFRIAENYFEDFSYSAIGLGNHYLQPDTCGTRGIVEHNEICMSESFRTGVFRGLIDSGGIYVWTMNNDLVIRDNYIHDIDGPHGNRGILCDDGCAHVRIERNRIFRIRNCYCIDLRKRLRIGRKPESHIRDVNVGNVVQDNVIDGRERFEVRFSDETSLKGKNIRVK